MLRDNGRAAWTVLAMMLMSLMLVCNPAASDLPISQSESPKPIQEVLEFEDVSERIGIDFKHSFGDTGKKYFTETVGSGVAIFDFDNDGDVDVFFVQNESLEAVEEPTNSGSRLFRNEFEESGGRLQFTDVTEAAGIHAQGRGMGAFAADVDNDGWTDLYITMHGANQLWRNLGHGRFQNITEASGTGDPGFSVSAAFVDYDRDGWLDLYVGNYVLYQLGTHLDCRTDNGKLDYCGPNAYNPAPDRMYRNLGDGRFVDVTARTGLGSHYGASLGVIAGDWNGDNWPDLYVANDGSDNFYWVSQKDGTFKNIALFAGCANNLNGFSEASMGLVSADVDGDGDEDLFMTHLLNESNTLYQNQGQGFFQDKTMATGLAGPSRGLTGFGTAALDVDLDGWLDLAIANGAVSLKGVSHQKSTASSYPYDQPNQLLRNIGGRYEDISSLGGPGLLASETSRGLAVGDLNNDGEQDLVIQNILGKPRILLGIKNNYPNWLGLEIKAPEHQRFALGAKVLLEKVDGMTLVRTVRAGESFASSMDPRVIFGLGETPEIRSLEIHWPDGTREKFSQWQLNQYNPIAKGQGQPLEAESLSP